MIHTELTISVSGTLFCVLSILALCCETLMFWQDMAALQPSEGQSFKEEGLTGPSPRYVNGL
jgi:hypothetical protein